MEFLDVLEENASPSRAQKFVEVIPVKEEFKPLRAMVEYPNPLAEAVVIIGYQSREVSTFLIRPQKSGLYEFQIWPKTQPLAFHWIRRLTFSQDVPQRSEEFTREELERGGCPPRLLWFSILECPKDTHIHERWSWSLVRLSDDIEPSRIREPQQRQNPVATGNLRFPQLENLKAESKRIVFWSCNQPFRTKVDGTADMNSESLKIYKWYAKKVEQFNPHLVWAMGDTAYADGTVALDFCNAYYSAKRDWHDNSLRKAELREHYRRMYLYHWSFPAFQSVTRNYPHMLLWDDHEIHGGWGSRNKDYKVANHFATFQAARDVANEFVFSTGPRLSNRSDSDAHMGLVLDSIAVFAFDIRSSRNYMQSRILSLEQKLAFSNFLVEYVVPNANIRSLIISTSTPLAYIMPFTEQIGSRIPYHIRSDIRDEWPTPNTAPTMEWLFGELGRLQKIRPEVNLVNLSGDIHVSNAFQLHPKGLKTPLYQITSSALTNRSHLKATLRKVVTLRNVTKFEDTRGFCHRLWPDCGKPNFLLVQAEGDSITFRLKSFGMKNDRRIVLKYGRLIDLVD